MAKCEVCKKEMLRAYGCSVKNVYCNGKKYKRLKVGEEGWIEEGRRCGDCGAKYGYFHHWGCDIERCPSCGGQLLGCECEDVHLLV